MACTITGVISSELAFVRRESDEEDVSGSDVGEELAADEIEASDSSAADDLEAPGRKRRAPQTALKVRAPRCLQQWGPSQMHATHRVPQNACPILGIPHRAVPILLSILNIIMNMLI